MLFIVLGGLIGILTLKRFKNVVQISKSGIVLLLFFALWSIVVIISSKSDIPQQIYGVYGRNTGVALYFGLAVLAFIASSIKTKELSSKIVWGLLVAGLISTAFGTMQNFNLDILSWNVSGREINGLFGNSNFHSSFLGISSIAVLTLIIFPSTLKCRKSLLVGFFVLSVWNIYVSNSIQGFFVLIVGVTVILYFKIPQHLNKSFRLIYVTFIMIVGTFSSLGLFGSGPLAGILRFKTIEVREFYWSSGIAMVKNSLVFGSGFDTYGDLYRLFRSPSSTVEFGPDLVSNAAHNVFIDLAVNGGLPLLGAYILLIAFTFKRAITIIRRKKELDPFFLSIFASWIGYLSQLFVSMNQVSLAIWGWLLMGAIIGYEKTTRDPQVLTLKGTSLKSKSDFGLDPSLSMRFLGGALIGSLFILPPFLGEAKFRSALQSSNAEKIKIAALSWPRNPVFMVKATEIFRDNRLEKDALEMGLRTVEQFPKSIYAWRTLLSIEKLDLDLKEKARAKLRELDPLIKNNL